MVVAGGLSGDALQRARPSVTGQRSESPAHGRQKGRKSSKSGLNP